METKHRNRKPSILMLPWLAHGHITPYLALAKKLSQQNFHIYFCSTSINLQSISQNLGENFSSSIQLTDLQLPCTFPELHDPYNHTTKNIPRRLIPTLIAAFDAAKPSFCNVLETLKPILVIYDLFQPWAAEAAYQHDIAAVAKESSSVVYVSFGSEYFLSKEEMNEIASGLLLSEVSFIWVVRFHSEGKLTIEEALP
ncbi:hypothetical protein WN943_026068 [Citrus x changshan-huyou]